VGSIPARSQIYAEARILEIGQILLEIRQRVLALQNVPEYFQIFNYNSERLRMV
jgi:hypothetical protein